MLYPQDKIVLGFYDIVFSEDLPKSYPMYLINKTDCDITLGRAYRIEKYKKGYGVLSRETAILEMTH